MSSLSGPLCLCSHSNLAGCNNFAIKYQELAHLPACYPKDITNTPGAPWSPSACMHQLMIIQQDVLEMRQKGWRARRVQEGPKKIEDVHREAARELEAQAQRDMDERRGGRRGGDRGPPGPPPRGGPGFDRLMSKVSSHACMGSRGTVLLLGPHFLDYSTEESMSRRPLLCPSSLTTGRGAQQGAKLLLLPAPGVCRPVPAPTPVWSTRTRSQPKPGSSGRRSSSRGQGPRARRPWPR
jgi:hypothetical protein